MQGATLLLPLLLLVLALVLAGGTLVRAEENEFEERGLRDSIKQITQKVTGVPSLGKLMRSVNMTEIARASTKVAKELSKSLRMDVFAAGKALAAAGAAMGSIVFLGGMAGLLATGLGMFRYSPELYESSYFSNRIGSTYPSIPYLSDAQSIIYQKVQQAQQQFLGAQGQPTAASVPRAGVSIQSIGQRPNGQHPVSQHPVGQHPIGQHPIGQHPVGPHPVGQHVKKDEYYGERNGQGQQGRSEEEIKMSARDARILKETKKPYSDDLMPALADLFKAITNNVEKVAPGVAEALRR